MLVPAAIAWACNPQAHISLNQTSVSPGQTITVYGSYFQNAPITVSSPGSSKTVTPSGGGFVTTITAPQQPGAYVVSASKPTGGFASASFSVTAPAARPAPQAAPETPSASAPTRSAPSFGSPAPVRSERQGASSPGSSDGGGGDPVAQRAPSDGGSGSGGGAPAGGGAGGGPSSGGAGAAPPSSGVVTTQSGTQAFADSVAPTTSSAPFGAPAAASGKAAKSSGGSSAAPSEEAATSDVWGSYATGRTPSLTSEASGMDEGTGSAGIGIAMLAVALLALAGGLAAAEAKRRRTA